MNICDSDGATPMAIAASTGAEQVLEVPAWCLRIAMTSIHLQTTVYSNGWSAIGIPSAPTCFNTRRQIAGHTIENSRIRFHHFILRQLFLVIISSWLTSKKSGGRITSRNLSDLHLLPHLIQQTQSLHQKTLGELFFVKISCPLHQNILGELNRNPRRVPPCAVKTCVVRPVFARVGGELRAADPSNVQGPVR